MTTGNDYDFEDEELFTPGFYYLTDYAGNISGPYDSRELAVADAVAGDRLLLCLDTNFKRTKKEEKKKVTEITLDFNRNVVKIAGNEVELNKVTYAVGESEIDKEELNSWYSIVTDAYKACERTTIVGTPPVKGVCLNEMLHL